MLITVIASWQVASRSLAGFWLFLVSNLLWAAWGLGAHAYALIVLQGCLAVANFRGRRRNSGSPAVDAAGIR
jgi:hypothetical protein